MKTATRRRRVKKASSAPTRRRRNPSEGSPWPWVAGGVAALLTGFAAYKWVKTPDPTPPQFLQQQQQPGPPPGYAAQTIGTQQYYLPTSPQPMALPHGVQGMYGTRDRSGVPWIALPAESAARTLQAQLVRPQLGAPVMPISQQEANRMAMSGVQAPQAAPVAQQESFGGGGEGGSLGGESF